MVVFTSQGRCSKGDSDTGQMAGRKPVRPANTHKMQIFLSALKAVYGPRAPGSVPSAPASPSVSTPRPGRDSWQPLLRELSFSCRHILSFYLSDKSQSESLHLLSDKEKREETLGSRWFTCWNCKNNGGNISNKPSHPLLTTLGDIQTLRDPGPAILYKSNYRSCRRAL